MHRLAASNLTSTRVRRSSTATQQQQQQHSNSKRQVIYAPLGGKAVLSCPLDSSEDEDAVSLVLWYKDKATVPIYR